MSPSELFASRSIRTTIAVSLCTFVFVTVLIVEAVSYKLTEDTVVKNSESYGYELVAEAGQNIDSYISFMKNISSVILYNRQVLSYLRDPTDRKAADITGLLGSITRTRKDITLIGLFGTNGTFVSDAPNLSLNPYVRISEAAWYRDAMAANGAPAISPAHVQNVIKNRYRWVVSLSREISDPRSGKPLGVLLVDLSFRVIRDICSNIDLGQRGYVFIVANQGTIIYHPQLQLIYSNLKKEKIARVLSTRGRSFTTGAGKDRRIYTIWTSAETGWKVVGVTYMSALVSETLFVRVYYALLGMACITVVILLSLLFSFRITRPIKLLIDSMEQAEKGDFNVQVSVDAPDEIGALGSRFNLMIAQIRELIAQNAREHDAKRRAELHALQAQINPHFLYNTLDSIVWMAESKRHDQVVTMVSSLARLLRLSISRGDEIITIREEIEHITHYLTIQKMRYRDKLDFTIDVEEGILELAILKLLLQPLVENSIYHGIKNKRGLGTIAITGSRVGSRVLIQVKDSGVGMSEEALCALRTDGAAEATGLSAGSIGSAEGAAAGAAAEAAGAAGAAGVAAAADGASEPRAERDSRRRGVGLRNVDERIKLSFGEEFGLAFESAPGAGTTVSVRLPARPVR